MAELASAHALRIFCDGRKSPLLLNLLATQPGRVACSDVNLALDGEARPAISSLPLKLLVGRFCFSIQFGRESRVQKMPRSCEAFLFVAVALCTAHLDPAVRDRHKHDANPHPSQADQTVPVRVLAACPPGRHRRPGLRRASSRFVVAVAYAIPSACFLSEDSEPIEEEVRRACSGPGVAAAVLPEFVTRCAAAQGMARGQGQGESRSPERSAGTGCRAGRSRTLEAKRPLARTGAKSPEKAMNFRKYGSTDGHRLQPVEPGARQAPHAGKAGADRTQCSWPPQAAVTWPSHDAGQGCGSGAATWPTLCVGRAAGPQGRRRRAVSGTPCNCRARTPQRRPPPSARTSTPTRPSRAPSPTRAR